ncbi:MAG: glycoside hydrolase family 3 C-terminal domain-containing protein [Clostridia bacterium]|nr:glycoside hydrolase family 3 C-terminal domain-containing protein [Clostridia bacterium]
MAKSKKYDINKLTLEEKILLLTGVNEWKTYSANGKVPQIVVSDGPNGLQMFDDDNNRKSATAMPALSLVAQTWDKELAYLDGETIANDAIENGADILLAPGVNIKRTPLNGRNFEYFSEDPMLSGVLAREFIKGVQDRGVGTSLKHFCANNREKGRRVQTSEIDERTLNEIYYRPFEIALEAKPWTVMCAYNPVNGVYASENKKLLKGVLRDKLGFDGLIVSDWASVQNPYKSIKATIDLIMPYNELTLDSVKEALAKGNISMEEIDYCVENVLNLVEKVQNSTPKMNYNKEQRHQNAVKIAKAGITLLKNEDNILPLKDGGKYLVVGDLSETPLGGLGSAYVQTDYVQEPVAKLLAEKLPKSEVGYDRAACACASWAGSNRIKLEYAKRVYTEAYEKDAVIVFVSGDTESESFDRSHIKLKKEYEEVIRNLARYNENIIVVINATSAIDMQDWIDDVKAVVIEGFAGEATNEAISSILAGETNPSGKLAESFPYDLEDTFTGDDTGNGLVEWYNDGIFVGYRYYEKYGIDVLFPFGHGLSYSEFKYDNLSIEQTGECDFTVSYDITNVSNVDGAEVSQVYVKDVFSMVIRPEKELKGFEKTFIKAGETKRVSVKLDFRSFAYYNTALDKWHVENGAFTVLVGASSADIKLTGKININLDDSTQQSQALVGR